jgi:hypothetical protein
LENKVNGQVLKVGATRILPKNNHWKVSHKILEILKKFSMPTPLLLLPKKKKDLFFTL